MRSILKLLLICCLLICGVVQGREESQSCRSRTCAPKVLTGPAPDVIGITGSPGPFWIPSNAFAALRFNSSGDWSIQSGQALPFNYQHSVGIAVGTSALTIQNSGVYLIGVGMNGIKDTGLRSLSLWQNGSNPPAGYFEGLISAGSVDIEGSVVLPAAAGDVFELVASVDTLSGHTNAIGYWISILQVG